MLLIFILACDGPPPSGVIELPTDFCAETRSPISPDEPTAAGLSASELAAGVPMELTLNITWETASMAGFEQVIWTWESAGEDPVFIQREHPERGDCGARVEVSLRGQMTFSDGSAATVDGRLFGSSTEAPQFRALDVLPEVEQPLEDALVLSLYERNPPDTFDPYDPNTFWFWPHPWVMLNGDWDAGGRITMINQFTRADIPSQRIMASGAWVPAP